MQITSVIILLMFSATLKSGAQFKEGVIVDKYGKAYPGLLKLPERETDHFHSKICEQTLPYKESANGRKERLTVNDIKAFKVESDSFLVVKNYSFPLDNLVHNVFAKVVLKGANGILCSFTERILVAGNPSVNRSTFITRLETFYLIYRDKQFTQLSDYNFAQEMPLLISDRPDLHKDFKSKSLKFKDIESIIANYASPTR